MGSFLAILLGSFLIISLVAIYVCYVRMLIKLAKRIGVHKNLWLLWIPFAQGYILYQMAGSKIWTFYLSLLFFIPYLNLICYIIPVIWFWKIATKLHYSGWWGIIFPLWVLLLDLETMEDKKIKRTKEEIVLSEKKDNDNFLSMLKSMGLLVLFLLIILLIRKIFF